MARTQHNRSVVTLGATVAVAASLISAISGPASAQNTHHNGTYGNYGTYGNNGSYGTYGNNGNYGTYGNNGNNGGYRNNGYYTPANVNVSAGTTIPIIFDTKLSSSGSWSGEQFTAHVSNPGYTYNGNYNNGNYGNYGGNGNYNNQLPDGTRIYGHVTAAYSKQNNEQGFLGLAFDRIVLPNGPSYQVQAVPAGTSGAAVDVRSDGSVVARSQSTNNAIKDAAIGAAAGAIGDVLLNHGKIDLSHILIGGAAGYGVSRVNVGKQNNGDVTINPGDKVGMKFSNSLGSYGY